MINHFNRVLTPPLTDFLDYMDSEHLGDRSKQFLISYYNLLQLLNTSHPYISSKITRSISAPRPQEPTAIDILPDEILLYIFSLIVPDTAPELLCAVYHHWNSLVKSSTLLWTQIVLNNTKHRFCLFVLSMSLARLQRSLAIFVSCSVAFQLEHVKH